MARNLLLAVLAIALVAAVFFGARLFLSRQSGPTAGLKVTSTPTASIFLDGRMIGRTPFEDKMEQGEYTVKLIPEGVVDNVISWQGKVKLSHSLLTYINRELGSSELTSAGEVLTLEKTSARLPEITIHTTPEGALVKLDNVDRGAASLELKGIEPGDHTLDVSAPGFIGRTIKIRTTGGYRLLAYIQLALGKEKVASESLETTAKPTLPVKKETTGKTTVKILDTPTSFLRVRSSASTISDEIGRVKPDETFTLLEEKDGWYKIMYKDTTEGWISSRYAEKIQ